MILSPFQKHKTDFDCARLILDLSPFVQGNSPTAQIVLSASLRGLAPPSLGSPQKPLSSYRAASPGGWKTRCVLLDVSGFLGSGGSAVPTGLNTLAFDDDVQCGRIKIVIHR